MKKIIILSILFLVLFSFGCNRLKQPDINYPIAVDYHRGTEGLDIEEVANLPPSEIMENSDFVIGLELRNKGAYDIEGARLTVYGFEGGYVFVKNPQINFDLEGKKAGFPEGGYEIVNFEAKNLAVPEVAKTYTAAYTVSAYYRYKTEASAEVCINPNIYTYVKTKETVCEPKEIILSGGQGAPVAVTKIDQSFTPYETKIKANFLITFANKGDGEVVEGVYVGDVRLSNVPLVCILPEGGMIKLKANEEKSVLCSGEVLLSSGTYIAPLSIELVYDYTTKLNEKVIIKSLREVPS